MLKLIAISYCNCSSWVMGARGGKTAPIRSFPNRIKMVWVMNLNLCYFSFYLPPPSPNPLGVRLLLLSINCRNFKLLFYKFIFTSLLWKYIMHHSWRKYWISGLHPVGEFTFDDIRKKLMSVKIFLYILKAYMMVYINTMFWDPPSPPPPTRGNPALPPI